MRSKNSPPSVFSTTPLLTGLNIYKNKNINTFVVRSVTTGRWNGFLRNSHGQHYVLNGNKAEFMHTRLTLTPFHVRYKP